MCTPLSQAGPVSLPCTTFFNMEDRDWFKIKRYPHIGRPISEKDRIWVKQYVENESKVAAHNFYPFIHRKKLVRKFRKTYKNGIRSAFRSATNKPRELYYANHFDSNIYSYYAKLFNEAYNRKLEENGIDECITAYRRIKINKENPNSSNKSNSDFAADVFNFIINNETQHLIAVTFDVKSFFDTLNHGKLKKAMCQVLEVSTLRKDFFNIYKNITKFSFINENELFKEFSNDILVRNKGGLIRRTKVKKLKYLRSQNAIAFCETKDFKARILQKNLVIANRFIDKNDKNERTIGIPQGSPISAVLANLYMINFDKQINKHIGRMGGLYRRYSDDMVIICPFQFEHAILNLFKKTIEERQLTIQDSKTQIFHFIKNRERYFCYQKYLGNLNFNKKFEYLGFEFDGHHSYIKSASLSSYYRKMKRFIIRSRFYSSVDKSKNGIFRSRLYRLFSYKGAMRKRVYRQDLNDPKKWSITQKYNWGNFISYANLAHNKLPNNKIKNQIKRHWSILNQLILAKIGLPEKEK